MNVHSHEVHFPTIHYGCWKGRKTAHAAGALITYVQGSNGSSVGIESINSQGSITTGCRIPLPNNPAVLREVAGILKALAKEIETNG
jgi:hypothetical protein